MAKRDRKGGRNDELVRTSKFLSLVLRHSPETVGLQLEEGGWLDIDTLLAACARRNRPITREQLDRVVVENDKKRFAIDETGARIRAVQGHSKAVDLGYTPQTPPDMLYHGTVDRFLASILAEGLIPGNRQHVHLSADVETATKVGSRRGKPVILSVDAAALHATGAPFYRAENGVWLADKVPPEFLARV